MRPNLTFWVTSVVVLTPDKTFDPDDFQQGIY